MNLGPTAEMCIVERSYLEEINLERKELLNSYSSKLYELQCHKIKSTKRQHHNVNK